MPHPHLNSAVRKKMEGGSFKSSSDFFIFFPHTTPKFSIWKKKAGMFCRNFALYHLNAASALSSHWQIMLVPSFSPCWCLIHDLGEPLRTEFPWVLRHLWYQEALRCIFRNTKVSSCHSGWCATSGTGSLTAPLVPKYIGKCVMDLWIPNFHFYSGGNNAYNSKPQRIKWNLLPKYYI